MTPAPQTLQNTCHDSTEFFWFDWPARSADKVWLGVCGGLADKWNVNAWVVRIAFFLFVVPLGFVYYLGAQNMPTPSVQ